MKNCKEFYEFQLQRNSTRLSRSLLTLIEDLRAQHEFNQKALLEALPEEYHSIIRLSNPLTDEKMKYVRKRILDSTNDCTREILADLKNYEIEFNFKQENGNIR